MTVAWHIRVYEEQQLVYSADCCGPVELGRQSDSEENPYSQRLKDGQARVIIAGMSEENISRKHVRFEPLPDGRVRLTNVSESLPIRMPDGNKLGPGGTTEVFLPAIVGLGRKIIRLQEAEAEAIELENLAELPGAPGYTDSDVDRWLEPNLAASTLPPPDNEPQPADLPNEPFAYEDDAAKVKRLLDLIAAQSHFEERYELRKKIAKGGMGQIYRAYDRILRREVAIKMVLESHGFDAAIRGQFLKEARVGGRLLHPNILAVFDLGVNHRGQTYYTMRLVDGASLQHCLDSLDATQLVSYPLRKIVEGLTRVCHGVDYAHQNRVIHLDIKPNNILVSGFNEFFVIDWGLARVDEVDDTEELVDLYRSTSVSTMMKTAVGGGRVVGTPGYMAPEQFVGDYQSFDASTDVYGLGGILYFVLYGQGPNQDKSFQEARASSSEPKKKGKLRQGILPRGRRVKKEAQDAIEALESICLKALEPDKAKRYPDAEKMLIELNEWLSNTPGATLGT